MGYVTGGGGSGSGGAPSGAAGGELAGTYPSPTVADGVIDDANIVSGGLTNAALATAAAIANTKLATNPLARANHTGSQTMSTISDAGSLATKSAVASADITDGTIVNADVNAAAAIAVTKIAAGTDTQVLTTSGSTVNWASAAGGAPTGAAGGDLTGTYPNPTIGTSKVTSTHIVDGTIAGGDLNSAIAIPSGATASTAAVNTSSTALATTAYVVTQMNTAGVVSQIGANTFATVHPATVNSTATSANAGDGRWVRLMIPKTGTLHDVSWLSTNAAGNFNILVLDDGQANGTHTVRTALYIKGGTNAVPAAGSWMTGDASLVVNAGDTLVFMITFDGTTGSAASGIGGKTGLGSLPTSSFFPGSGAATTSQKLYGTCLSANVPTTTSGAGSTVTDANMVAAANCGYAVFRIT